MAIPKMPEGFTDQAAWDAIHYKFGQNSAIMDAAVVEWQLQNQDRVKAAVKALYDLLMRENAAINLERSFEGSTQEPKVEF